MYAIVKLPTFCFGTSGQRYCSGYLIRILSAFWSILSAIYHLLFSNFDDRLCYQGKYVRILQAFSGILLLFDIFPRGVRGLTPDRLRIFQAFWCILSVTFNNFVWNFMSQWVFVTPDNAIKILPAFYLLTSF